MSAQIPSLEEPVPCPCCGQLISRHATTCDDCRMRTRVRMQLLREYLVRTMEEPHCELPYVDRKLS
jgi:hypothetical protein